MKLDLATPPPEETCTIRVRIDPRLRYRLQFHLEASDGMGYLEADGPDPAAARVLVPPSYVDRIRRWLQESAAELGLEELSETEPQ